MTLLFVLLVSVGCEDFQEEDGKNLSSEEMQAAMDERNAVLAQFVADGKAVVEVSNEFYSRGSGEKENHLFLTDEASDEFDAKMVELCKKYDQSIEPEVDESETEYTVQTRGVSTVIKGKLTRKRNCTWCSNRYYADTYVIEGRRPGRLRVILEQGSFEKIVTKDNVDKVSTKHHTSKRRTHYSYHESFNPYRGPINLKLK